MRVGLFALPAACYDPGAMLRINNITCRIAGRVLLEGASAVVPVGHRVGLVGPNGSGKSTLLRLITGGIEPDDGDIKLRRRARIATVAQEAPSGPMNLLEAVVAADRERADLLAEADTATDAHRIAELHTRLVDIDAHSAEARAGAILAGLGFDADAQRRPLDSFSGGWRMRVALAGTLFTEPDLLLLDEPTNYLDLEGTMWLEGYLATYSHTLLVVSHDRDLLNSVAKTILHIDGGRLTSYTGNYDDFVRVRTERLAQQVAERAKIDAQRRHMQAFVDRFRYKASKARQAAARAREDKSALRRAVRDAEALVAKLTAEVAKIEASLAGPEVYQGPTAALAKLAKRRSDVKRRAAAAEQAWLAAQQAIDTAAE